MGYNVYGQLGNGTTAQSSSPVAVSSFNQGAAPTATYTYDGDGLRRTKTVAGTRTDFTWDASGGLPLLVDDGTNSYLYGPDGLPISQIGPGNVVTWYHHDQLGSTRTLTSSTGAVVGRATYDPYGRLTASVGTLSPLGFAGEYTDAETGFVYLRARYYDPATGQFISRDPIEAITRSPYGYVGGNPLNAVDPLGLFVHKAIGGLVPDCPFGKNSNGSCTGSGTVQKYADDVSRVAGLVLSACGVGAVLTSATVVGGTAFGACATVARGVSIGSGALHTAITCADVDAYCARSAASTVLAYGSGRLAGAVGPSAPFLGAVGDDAALWGLTTYVPQVSGGLQVEFLDYDPKPAHDRQMTAECR